MKSASLPSLRVAPELRQAAEAVLDEGETLSAFVEQAVRECIARRRWRGEFIARGLAARDRARASGDYVEGSAVLAALEARLRRAKAERGAE